jgi:hypothetical protein
MDCCILAINGTGTVPRSREAEHSLTLSINQTQRISIDPANPERAGI